MLPLTSLLLSDLPLISDPQVDNFRRINHNMDPIPILPGRALGFSHVKGEIHITGSNSWNSCGGDDDTESGCTISAVPNIFISNIFDHLGPYQGVRMGRAACG